MKSLRQKEIIALLERDSVINTAALSQQFGVSIETIRRDLDQLEKQGILKKTYGGAELREKPTVLPSPLLRRRGSERSAKLAIARQAAAHVPNGSVVALDAGSTIFELCEFLKERSGLTIICSDIHSPDALLSSQNRIYLLGGFLTRDGTSSGAFAKEFLNSISNIDIFLCSADGAHPEDGLSTDEIGISELKKRYLRKAAFSIAMLDHSKFTRKGFYKTCNFNEFNLVITDSGTPVDVVERIRSCGTAVEIAQL